MENKTLQNERSNKTKLTFNIYQASFSAVLQFIYRPQLNEYVKVAQELPVSHPHICSVGWWIFIVLFTLANCNCPKSQIHLLLCVSSQTREQVLRKSNKPINFTMKIEQFKTWISRTKLSELILNPDLYPVKQSLSGGQTDVYLWSADKLLDKTVSMYPREKLLRLVIK